MRTLLLGAVFAAASPVHCLAQADAPVARPEVKVGDRWAYRRMDYWTNRNVGTYDLRVTFVNEKSILAVVADLGRSETDASYTAEWNATVSAWDQAVIAPDTGLLRFPLRVGDSYTASFRMESTRKGGETNARAIQGVSSTDFDYKVKVVRWEEISVPAGRFRALRIEAEGNLRRAQATGPGGNGFARTVIWYAPEVKRWVKYLYEDSLPRFAGVLAPNERMVEELVLFQPQ